MTFPAVMFPNTFNTCQVTCRNTPLPYKCTAERLSAAARYSLKWKLLVPCTGRTRGDLLHGQTGWTAALKLLRTRLLLTVAASVLWVAGAEQHALARALQHCTEPAAKRSAESSCQKNLAKLELPLFPINFPTVARISSRRASLQLLLTPMGGYMGLGTLLLWPSPLDNAE